MENDCIFCKIINNEIQSETVFEDEYVKVIKDINPKAPIHLLIIPKNKQEAHIPSIKEIGIEDKEILIQIILAAKKVAEDKNLKGYKLIFNVGLEGGQMIDHLHLHLLGGWSQETHHADV